MAAEHRRPLPLEKIMPTNSGWQDGGKVGGVKGSPMNNAINKRCHPNSTDQRVIPDGRLGIGYGTDGSVTPVTLFLFFFFSSCFCCFFCPASHKP